MAFRCKLFMIHALIVAGILLGCDKAPEKDNTNASKQVQRDLFHEIQVAIKDYMKSNPEKAKDFEKLLLPLITAKKCVPDSTGFRVGDWSFEQKNARLVNLGFIIGNEHTFYEIDLQIDPDKVKVLKISKNREIYEGNPEEFFR